MPSRSCAAAMRLSHPAASLHSSGDFIGLVIRRAPVGVRPGVQCSFFGVDPHAHAAIVGTDESDGRNLFQFVAVCKCLPISVAAQEIEFSIHNPVTPRNDHERVPSCKTLQRCGNVSPISSLQQAVIALSAAQRTEHEERKLFHDSSRSHVPTNESKDDGCRLIS